MKKSTLTVFFLLSLLTPYSYGQIKYIVTAENGLILRNTPDSSGENLGKLTYGAQVQIIEKTKNSQILQDNGKDIKGTWVKIKVENQTYFVSNNDSGYVFDGYLKKKSEMIKDIADEVFKHTEFKSLSISSEMEPFFLRGDFFGDHVNDLVVLLENNKNQTMIGFINYGNNTKVYILGTENDPFNMYDYSWVGIFQKVKKGEVLWSNYEDDFVEYKDIPENKKVRLNYNALYLHASESCGGGYVFWKDGKFTWLQQE